MQTTTKTLLEQLQISDAEIHHRLELVGVSPEHMLQLKALFEVISRDVDDIVEDFYESQLKIDEIAILIGDADTLFRLKNAQRQYILDLFSGHYNNQYVNNRLRIGLVHKRIGVEPKLYLSGIFTLKRMLFENLNRNIADIEKCASAKEALDRLLYFDTTFVFDTYIESLLREVDVAKKKAEEYAGSLEIKVAERTRQLERLSKRDPLTGLYNQTEMRNLFAHQMLSIKRRDSVISVIYCDLDGFKAINDQYGHLKGDEILSALADAIRAAVREVDIACRYGGDEFCLICPDANTGAAIVIAQRILDNFQQEHPTCDLSFGIAEAGSDTKQTTDELLSLADQRMYQSKKEQGAFYCDGHAPVKMTRTA